MGLRKSGGPLRAVCWWARGTQPDDSAASQARAAGMRSSWVRWLPEGQAARAKVYAESFPPPGPAFMGPRRQLFNSPSGVYLKLIAPVNSINHNTMNLPLERFREWMAVLGTGRCLLPSFQRSRKLWPSGLPFPLSLAFLGFGSRWKWMNSFCLRTHTIFPS